MNSNDRPAEHAPDAGFAAHLEWQLRTALRRQERFAKPVRGPALRVVRTAALMLVSVLAGAGAVIASERIQGGGERSDLVRRKAELQLALSESRLADEQRALEIARAQAEAGIATEGEVLELAARLENAELDVRVLRIDLEETTLTGLEPQREIDAPSVSGRDFVAERIRVETERYRGREERVRSRLEIARRRVEAGIANTSELFEIERELIGASARSKEQKRRLELRLGYGGKQLSREELRIRIRAAEAQRKREVLQFEVEHTQRSLERTTELAKLEVVSTDEVRWLRSRLEQVRGELGVVELELKLVRSELEALEQTRRARER